MACYTALLADVLQPVIPPCLRMRYGLLHPPLLANVLQPVTPPCFLMFYSLLHPFACECSMALLADVLRPFTSPCLLAAKEDVIFPVG